jgi:predicted membrane channel-forming protein YqfA (hemolysin III family)
VVRRFFELVYAVLWSNNNSNIKSATKTSKRSSKYSTLLGAHGHLERFSALSHLLGFVLLLTYAIVRTSDPLLPSNPNKYSTIPPWLNVASAYVGAFVFLSSSIYHVTSPDKELSYYSRVLDFSAIYLGLGTSTVADVALSTNGFANVNVLSILDVPLAVGITLVFFLWKRWAVPMDSSWTSSSAFEPRCSLSLGLFHFFHHDDEHSTVRQATSLVLASCYFVAVPAAYETFDTETATLIVVLQATAFGLLVAGMVIDNVLMWPDIKLIKGELSCLSCPRQGCMLNSHALWHLISLCSVAVAFVAREIGLREQI